MSTEQDRSPVTQRYQTSTTQPATRQAVKFLTAATISGSLMVLSGLTVTFTVIALVVATPLMVIFSPVLVPAVLTLLVLAAGFLFSGACGASAVAALSWLYRYVKGKHPVGADQLDYARQKIAGAARDVTDRVKEFGQ